MSGRPFFVSLSARIAKILECRRNTTPPLSSTRKLLRGQSSSEETSPLTAAYAKLGWQPLHGVSSARTGQHPPNRSKETCPKLAAACLLACSVPQAEYRGRTSACTNRDEPFSSRRPGQCAQYPCSSWARSVVMPADAPKPDATPVTRKNKPNLADYEIAKAQ